MDGIAVNGEGKYFVHAGDIVPPPKDVLFRAGTGIDQGAVPVDVEAGVAFQVPSLPLMALGRIVVHRGHHQ